MLFGLDEPGGTLQGLATIPEALWELLLGAYCTLRGFRPSSSILGGTPLDGPEGGTRAAAPA